MNDQERRYAWYSNLRQQGLLISPAVLIETFPEGGRQLSPYEYDRLRVQYNRFLAQVKAAEEQGTPLPAAAIREWVDTLMVDALGHSAEQWWKQDRLDTWTVRLPTGERLKPSRALMGPDNRPSLLVLVDDARRLGVGRSRNRYARLLALLRGNGVKLGLFTNGLQFRLCYAGLDHDSWLEWEAEAWFGGAETRDQLDGFLMLMGPEAFKPDDNGSFPLLSAVEASRTRQGELAQVLGEQVRQAVERLLDGLPAVLERRPDLAHALAGGGSAPLSQAEQWRALYQAAIRLIMRIVVVLYAESRDLLPRSNVFYHQSYSVEQLFFNLEAAHRQEPSEMRERRGAWRQLLSLFRLIHQGSAHKDLPVPAYGGQLFASGDAAHPDPVRRALALFEANEYQLSDADVYEILRLLKFSKFRVRSGRQSKMITGPVDFSDLRTEYIGIMYQGLLDYELRRVGEEPMVMLGIGSEPVLPLSLLESLDDRNLKDLIKKLGKVDKGADEADEEEAAGEGDYEIESDAMPLAAESPMDFIEADEQGEDDQESTDQEESEQTSHQRALAWALRAVEVAGIVKRPRRGTDWLYEKKRRKAAAALIKATFDPGSFYLARWRGMRKGSGTFYTRPQLAVPLTHRTLEPLCYERLNDGNLWPKTPEEILSLKICDPAMGSGSFLVAALNYVTDALVASLHAHGRLVSTGTDTVVLLSGDKATGREGEELLPCRVDDPRFDDMLRARLKRLVVERCIYGVDINPLAVELARVSLWIETMDRNLPFEFLDHKLKVGNSLVGGWLDQVAHYPAKAWERDGGDLGHNGVHIQPGEVTKKIKSIYQEEVKPQLRNWLTQSDRQLRFELDPVAKTVVADQAKLGQVVASLQNLRMSDELEVAYAKRVLESEEYRQLKALLDRWCAVWFWPVHKEDLPPLTPKEFWSPSEEVRRAVAVVARQNAFFHWEIEFPDVFTADRRGFDAVLGNPPWEIMKPMSKEFFSNRDPIYRTYGKREALEHQRRLFRHDPAFEQEWLEYNARFRAMSNWVRNVATPFDVSLARGKEGRILAERWRELRAGQQCMADPEHPFAHQGGADLNSYKLFLELAYRILKDGGRLGFLVPSGIYTDQGARDLRALFLDRSKWEWLYAFHNRLLIFDIHSNFKFCALIVQKGGRTESVKTAFMRDDLSTWEQAQSDVTPVSREQVNRLSPLNRAFLEINSSRDLKILEELHERNPVLGDPRCPWKVSYTAEFHMTNDSKLFPPLEQWLAKGYRPDGLGRWIGPNGEIALPLYEGRMVGQFDFSNKGWVSGKGRRAVWRQIPWDNKVIQPQYLIRLEHAVESALARPYKIAFMDVSSATNTRTMIAAYVGTFPCGNSAPVLTLGDGGLEKHLALVAILNSFVYDCLIRVRAGGLHLNFFYLEETPVPPLPSEQIMRFLVLNTASLNLCSAIFAREWVELAKVYPELKAAPWRSHWALTREERLRKRCMLDAVVAFMYGLSPDAFAHILRTDESNPIGFWRVDKQLPLQLRQTTLAIEAYKYLHKVGIDRFLREGWQLPRDRFAVDGHRIDDTVSDWSEAERIAVTLAAPYETWRASNAPPNPSSSRHPFVQTRLF